MKIVIYSLNFAPEITGIGKYTGEMASWLSEQGHEVHIITALPYYPEWKVHSEYSSYKYKVEKLCKSTVYRCPLWVPKSPGGLKRILHLLSFSVSSLPVLILNLCWRPGIVFTVEPPLFISPGVLFFSKIFGAKTWLHIQDLEVDAAFDLGLVPSVFRKFILWFEKTLMSFYSVISSISVRMIDKIREKGVSHEPIHLFPNWVDVSEIYPLASGSAAKIKFGLSPDSVVALYSGNMGEKQGLEIIIEAAKLISKDSRIIFVMCGTGVAYPRLRQLADGLGNIVWLPLQPFSRLNELLNAADIHLLPQLAGVADLVMPSKLSGMMASGRPVIATVDKGSQIDCALKNSGRIVSPGDVSSFVNVLNELASNKTLRDYLGDQARKYAVENWGKDKVLSTFEATLMNS